MGIISLLRASIGGSDSTEDPKVVSNFNTLQTLLNGNIDATNLAARAGIVAAQLDAAVTAAAGLNDGTSVRRGKSIVATSESRANAAYGSLATPDRVQNVVLPADGLIAIAYQATWQESVAGAASAAIFLGANQLKIAGKIGTPSAPVTQEAVIGGEIAGGDEALATFSAGLCSTWVDGGSTAYGGDVTTGQIVGLGSNANTVATSLGGTRIAPASGAAVNFAGPCFVFAAAGAYDVSVQFKASSGSVTAKNRKLWVWALGF